MKILLADDDVDLFVKGHLEKRGHTVDLAYDGNNALSLIEKNDYDVVLLDQNMPEMSGLEIVKKVKQNPGIKARIIILTGYPTDIRLLAKSLGVDGYLKKPCQLKDIDDIIEKKGDNSI